MFRAVRSEGKRSALSRQCGPAILRQRPALSADCAVGPSGQSGRERWCAVEPPGTCLVCAQGWWECALRWAVLTALAAISCGLRERLCQGGGWAVRSPRAGQWLARVAVTWRGSAHWVGAVECWLWLCVERFVVGIGVVSLCCVHFWRRYSYSYFCTNCLCIRFFEKVIHKNKNISQQWVRVSRHWSPILSAYLWAANRTPVHYG